MTTTSFDATTHHKQTGMTLVELMLVMMLAGCLSGFSVSSWYHYQQMLRLEESAQELLTFLTHLQADANWHNTTALVWIKPGSPWCIGSGTLPAQCDSDDATRWQWGPRYPEILLQEYTQKSIGLYGLRATAQSGHITINNSAGSVRLIISSLGRLRLCSDGVRVGGIALC